MAQGQNLHLRLFLEGIEIPVIAASVQVAANTPATATIQVIATDKVLDLLPRTVVHLFYFDYVQTGNIAVDGKVRGGDEYHDWFNSRYKLLFMGELVTIKFQKSTTQRAVILECADFSNYWDTTFQYNFGGSLFGGRRKAAFIGANSNFFTSPLGHGTGTISRLLGGRSVNFPELRGLLAGVVRMLEAIGGSYYGRNTFRGANDFTSIAELRLKVLQQITAAEGDTSTAKLFARKAFNMWMNRSTQSLGKLVSFRGLVKTCFGFIFHEVYPCPVARFVPGSKRREKRRWTIPISDSGKHGQFARQADICLDMAKEAHENIGAWRKATPGNARARAAVTYIRSWKEFSRTARTLGQHGMVAGPKTAHKDLGVLANVTSEIWGRSTSASGNISSNLRSPESSGALIKLNREYSIILELYVRAINALKRILRTREKHSRSVTVPTVSRVNNQIFRPDIWYSSPPRCNVLFPEHYDTFSFARQYLREVSRLELQTHNEILGKDALFNGRYYAPNVEDVRRGAKLSSRRFARLIMNHELYTGIIPMFENLSEANLFAMRSGKVQRSGAKVGYAQRAVNFQYFKYRFESRGMSASGRFNPPFVPGFPSLLVDKHMDHAKLGISSMSPEDQSRALGVKSSTRGELLQKLVSPQYLGVCATLSHSVSQEGGMTSYQFIHARVHRESTEFLGVDKAEVTRIVGSSSGKPSVVAAPAVAPPKKGSRGPRGGTITSVRDVSKKYKGRVLKLLGQGSKVKIGDWYQDWFFRKVSVESGSQLLVGAYEVKETYTRRKKEKVDLPIEEAIRPPWIWDGWANPKVSDTYDQLFGIGSLTDIGGFNVSPNDPMDGTRHYLGESDLAGLQAEQAAIASSSGRKSASAKKADKRAAAKLAEAKSQNAVLMQDSERTIENSVDFLVRAYSFVKVNNLDVGDFLRAYGWRPVATMVEILGGSDLDIKAVTKIGKKTVKQRTVVKKARTVTIPQVGGGKRTEVLSKAVYGYKYVSRPVTRVGYEVSGKEGFHSRAFGDVEDLFGLVSPTVRRVLGLSDNKRKVASRMDVRKRRREVVRAYVAELTGSRGLIG